MPRCDRHANYLLSKDTIDCQKSVLSLLLAVVLPLGLSNAVRAQPLIFPGNAQTKESIDNSETIIYVDPQRGDDAQPGTSKQSALKTITKALELAQSGTTIQLAWGDYGEETGETFPLILKNNVTIKGTPGGKGHNTIIRGNGYFISPTGAGQNVTIAAIKEAGGIIGLTVINPHNRGHGLWIESANPTVSHNTFTRNGNTGVSANGQSSPIIEDNYFYNNGGNGLLIYGTSNSQVTNNIFDKTGFGVSLVQNATSTLKGNNFMDNRIGIILEGNSQAILRGNKITNSAESGLTAIANSLVDLGNSHEPGNNIFDGNDRLDIQNATNNEIVAVGTQTQGQIAGQINFARGEALAVANNTNNNYDSNLPPALTSRLPATSSSNSTTGERNLEPLPEQDGIFPPANNVAVEASPVAPPTAQESVLPPPPPVSQTETANTEPSELVFNAPSQPVPTPPEINTPKPLPVPSPTTENSPYTPSPLDSGRADVSSLSDLLSSSSSATTKYKVLVEVKSDRQQAEVRTLYPEAFATVYNGKSVLQIGAFSYWDKAKQASRSLEDMGLNAYILE